MVFLVRMIKVVKVLLVEVVVIENFVRGCSCGQICVVLGIRFGCGVDMSRMTAQKRL